MEKLDFQLWIIWRETYYFRSVLKNSPLKARNDAAVEKEEICRGLDLTRANNNGNVDIWVNTFVSATWKKLEKLIKVY